MRLDKRIVDVEYIKFKEDKSIETYERALITSEKKYSTRISLMDQQKVSAENLHRALKFKHKTLVDSLLVASSQKQTKKNIRRSIKVAKKICLA